MGVLDRLACVMVIFCLILIIKCVLTNILRMFFIEVLNSHVI